MLLCKRLRGRSRVFNLSAKPPTSSPKPQVFNFHSCLDPVLVGVGVWRLMSLQVWTLNLSAPSYPYVIFLHSQLWIWGPETEASAVIFSMYIYIYIFIYIYAYLYIYIHIRELSIWKNLSLYEIRYKIIYKIRYKIR